MNGRPLEERLAIAPHYRKFQLSDGTRYTAPLVFDEAQTHDIFDRCWQALVAYQEANLEDPILVIPVAEEDEISFGFILHRLFMFCPWMSERILRNFLVRQPIGKIQLAVCQTSLAQRRVVFYKTLTNSGRTVRDIYDRFYRYAPPNERPREVRFLLPLERAYRFQHESTAVPHLPGVTRLLFSNDWLFGCGLPWVTHKDTDVLQNGHLFYSAPPTARYLPPTTNNRPDQQPLIIPA